MNMKKAIPTKWWVSGLLIFTLILGGCGGGQPAEQAVSPEETTVQGDGEEASLIVETTEPADAEGDSESIIAKLASMTMPIELSYEMTFSSHGYNMTSSVWLKGEKSRVEGTNPTEGSYIILEDEKYTYILNPDEMSGIKMSLDDEDDFFDDDYGDDLLDADYDWDSMEYLGTETINGVLAYVFRDIEDNSKLWIHADYGFPIRMEGEEDGEAFVMEVTSFKIGGVSDSLFQVPSGYEIMEMGW